MSEKYKKIINSRIFITAILVLIQFVWIVILFNKLITHYAAINILFKLLSIIFVLAIVSKDENPAFKIGWLIIIMVAPLFGALLYLTSGDSKPSRKLRRILSKEHDIWKKHLVQDKNVTEQLERIDKRAVGTSQYLNNLSDYPVYQNTTVTYYPIGEKMYESMLDELEKAEHFIFLEYFIISQGVMWNNILDILIRKAKEGLDVRLIYDDWGCLTLLPPGYTREMEKHGIKCMSFNHVVPFLSLVMNNRDHRKIIVIDGHTAFNGGINLSDEYINEKERFGHWKDGGVKIVGDSVWNFTIMFLEMWNAFRKTDSGVEAFCPRTYHPEVFPSDGFVQPFADTPLDGESVAENVYLEIITQAKDYVYIFTPYLILDNEMKSALSLAAKRGVDVRLVTPGVPDKKLTYRLTRSNYLALLKAGVKIYEYTPGFLHAKSYVCDDEFGVVGTINMDYRSLYLHFECGTFLYRNKAVMELKKDTLETIERSRQVSKSDLRQGFLGRLLNSILQILAPLF